MSCKISIIVPHYKTEAYAHKCIDSILSQTLKDFELILVNDGSPDRCGKICDKYAQKDSRVKVIHKENGGYSSALNAGLDIAEGEYIGIVDGDDYIEKDMYETLYDLAKENDADIVECNFYVVNSDGVKPAEQNSKVEVGDNIYALNRLINNGMNTVLWNKIFRKNLFAQTRLPYGKIYADLHTTYKLLFYSKKYIYTGERKYFYFKREDSVMAQGEYSTKWLEELEFKEERFHFFRDNIKDAALLNYVEYTFCDAILYHYRMLCSKKADPDKKYRRFLKKKLTVNYSTFKRNAALRRYRIWMRLLRLNGLLYVVLYNCFLCFTNWFFGTKVFYRLINFTGHRQDLLA